jgi:hypothetical protein
MVPRMSTLSPSSVVLVSRYATYDDAPGLKYLVLRGRYEAQVRGTVGQLVIVDEPLCGSFPVLRQSWKDSVRFKGRRQSAKTVAPVGTLTSTKKAGYPPPLPLS